MLKIAHVSFVSKLVYIVLIGTITFPVKISIVHRDSLFLILNQTQVLNDEKSSMKNFFGMRSSRELERMTANAEVSTVMGSISASSD
jgi:hypothetical protein